MNEPRKGGIQRPCAPALGAVTSPTDSRWARPPGDRLTKIHAHRFGERRGDLVGVGRRRKLPFAAPRPVRADRGEPRLFGPDDAVAVRGPVVGRMAAPMIDRDHQHGIVSVFRVALQPGPQRVQLRIGARQRVEDAVVALLVRPVVCLVVGDIKSDRTGRLQVVERQAEGEGIVARAVPRRLRRELGVAERLGHRIGRVERLVSRIDRQRAFFVLGDPVEGFPRSEDADLLARHAERLPEELEHRQYG